MIGWSHWAIRINRLDTACVHICVSSDGFACRQKACSILRWSHSERMRSLFVCRTDRACSSVQMRKEFRVTWTMGPQLVELVGASAHLHVTIRAVIARCWDKPWALSLLA